jgi:hypothetical protein
MNRQDQLYVLKWMLDFVKADIEKLRPKEKVNLLMELDAALSGVLGESGMRHTFPYLMWNFASKESPETFVPKKIRRAMRLQEHLRTFVQETFQGIKRARESEGQWLGIEEFEKLYYLPAVTVKEATWQPSIQAEDDHSPDEEGWTDAPPQACWPLGSLSMGTIKVARCLPEDENALIFHFLEAMDGLPLKSFQECPVCGHWFILPDEKKRTYCSRSCGRKKANRDYHDKKKKDKPLLYEQELKDKKERAHKSYVDKVQAKNPKQGLKVERRPRKPKPKED